MAGEIKSDSTFDSSPHWSLVKILLTDAFGTPKGNN